MRQDENQKIRNQMNDRLRLKMFSSYSFRSAGPLALVVVVILFFPGCHCQHHHPSQLPRTSLSFDDTIDDFLRQAQSVDGHSSPNDAMDIQVSTCKISSQQLVATAQATAARVLKGVCNPSEIEDRFNNMEVQLGDQLNVVKAMLLSLEEKIVDQDQELKRQYRRLLGSMSGIRQKSGATSDQVSGTGNTNAPLTDDDEDEDTSEANEYGSSGSLPSSSSSTSGSGRTSSSNIGGVTGAGTVQTKTGRWGPRSDEIARYNSTVHIEGGKRLFSFYWVVSGMSYKLNNWNQKRALRSNSFYIYPGGYRMYMKIIPRYTTSSMYIHVGITKGEFDDSLSWPFVYNMRAQVLAQADHPGKGRAVDLKSRIWNPRELCSGSNWRKPQGGDNPECLGLGFPHDVIRTQEYIWNDRIIVKLTVYLD